jgi:hypothetical protein
MGLNLSQQMVSPTKGIKTFRINPSMAQGIEPNKAAESPFKIQFGSHSILDSPPFQTHPISLRSASNKVEYWWPLIERRSGTGRGNAKISRQNKVAKAVRLRPYRERQKAVKRFY